MGMKTWEKIPLRMVWDGDHNPKYVENESKDEDKNYSSRSKMGTRDTLDGGKWEQRLKATIILK